MKNNKRSFRIAMCSIIIFMICFLLGIIICRMRYANQKENEDKIEIFDVKYPGDGYTLFDAGYKGTVSPEDCCLILDEETAVPPLVFPGSVYVVDESEQKVISMENEIDGESYWRAKGEFKYLDVVLYDMETGEEIRRMDLLDVINKMCPGFQYDSVIDVILGADGHRYVASYLEDIPEKATDKEVEIVLFYDIDTGEALIKNTEEEWRSFMWGGWEKEDMEYREQLDEADWEWDKVLKKEVDNHHPCVNAIPSARGCAEIMIRCIDLPKENDSLYNRFPQLKEYVGMQGKKARIYVGGYPTVDEIKAMLCENAQ